MNTFLNFVGKALPLGVGSIFAAIAFPAGAQTLSTLKTPVNAVIAKSTAAGLPPSSQVIHVSVNLAPPNQAALEAFAKSVSDPTSANYGKFLTPAEVGTLYGPSTTTVQAVESYLTSQGFKIRLLADSHLVILADATVGQANAAFHTTIKNYHSTVAGDEGRVDYFAFSSPLQVPSTIASSILAVGGMENHTQGIPRFKRSRAKQAPATTLTPGQTSVLYDVAPLHNAGFLGQGRTVAISSFGGFQLSNVPLFYEQYGLTTPAGGAGSNVTIIQIGGGREGEDPNFEADLDIQMVLGQAPLCNLIVYDCAEDDIPCLAQEAQDNKADIITESYGWPYDASQAEAGHNIHLQMTAQGMTYLLASGDTGTNIAPEPDSYGDYDTELTNVGGTVATFTSGGSRLSEVGWDGSGGGWVTTPVVPFNSVLPSWQVGNGVPTNLPFRLIPDVALVAGGPNDTDAYFNFYENALNSGSGTSYSSPVFAGSLACSEQFLISKNYFLPTSQNKLRFGRINDLIYKQNGRSDIWFDITSGSNGILPNGTLSTSKPGWDFVTGWGAIDFNQFVKVLIAKPPISVLPGTVGIYAGMGANGTGVAANLAATDNLYYTVTSVPNAVGAVAAATMSYTLTTSSLTVAQLGLTLVDSAPLGVSSYVYLQNVHTGAFDLVSTSAMTGSNVTASIAVNKANYVSSGNKVIVVVRGVLPPRLGTNFTLKVNQATLTEGFNTQ